MFFKWFSKITLASTTVLDSTQINTGMWNVVKQLYLCIFYYGEHYQMKKKKNMGRKDNKVFYIV